VASAGYWGAVAVVAVSHDPVVVAWVEATAARQGVPVKVEEPGVVERVVTLLREGGEPVRAARRRRGGRGRIGSDPEPPG
jgi:hypothetical protein